MNRIHSAVVGALLLFSAPGCGQSDGGSGASLEGVTGAEALPVETWTVSEKPLLAIGSETQGEAFRFYRVEDARRLRDGRIVVSNAGTQEVRVFDGTGAFLFAFGGRGSGPGEFGSGSYLTLASFGDTLLVDDHRNGRVQLFGPGGQFIRSIPLGSASQGPERFAGRLHDGRLLAWSLVGAATMGGADGEQIHLSREYLLIDSEGGERVVVDTVPARSRIVHQQGELHDFMVVPFEIESSVVADQGSVLVGHHNAAHIERLDSRGQLVGTMEWAPPRIAAGEEMDRYRSHVMGLSPEELEGFWNGYFEKDLPVSDHLPVIAKILISEDGDVWVRRFRPVWVEGSEWDVLSSDGRWLTTVVPPDDVEIRQVGSNLVLGTRTDSLGIEQVVLHSLKRSSPD